MKQQHCVCFVDTVVVCLCVLGKQNVLLVMEVNIISLMIDRPGRQHFNAATSCKHVEHRNAKSNPKDDTALPKYVVLILSASTLNPSSYFCYVMQSTVNAFTLIQPGFTWQSGSLRWKPQEWVTNKDNCYWHISKSGNLFFYMCFQNSHGHWSLFVNYFSLTCYIFSYFSLFPL